MSGQQCSFSTGFSLRAPRQDISIGKPAGTNFTVKGGEDHHAAMAVGAGVTGLIVGGLAGYFGHDAIDPPETCTLQDCEMDFPKNCHAQEPPPTISQQCQAQLGKKTNEITFACLQEGIETGLLEIGGGDDAGLTCKNALMKKKNLASADMSKVGLGYVLNDEKDGVWNSCFGGEKNKDSPPTVVWSQKYDERKALEAIPLENLSFAKPYCSEDRVSFVDTYRQHVAKDGAARLEDLYSTCIYGVYKEGKQTAGSTSVYVEDDTCNTVLSNPRPSNAPGKGIWNAAFLASCQQGSFTKVDNLQKYTTDPNAKDNLGFSDYCGLFFGTGNEMCTRAGPTADDDGDDE